MSEIMAAKFFSLKPWEFRELTADRQAEVMAAFIVHNQIEHYYSSEEMKRMEKIRKDDPSNRASGMEIKGKRKH